MIQTNDSKIYQKREHPDIYLNKVTIQQSRYIAMHLGLFWGIGSFIIHNEDKIIIKSGTKTMFDHFLRNEKPQDDFIKTRSDFITQLINQRKLKIIYELLEKEENLASKLL